MSTLRISSTAIGPYRFSACPSLSLHLLYQGIIPTLVTYFDHDIPKARKAILIGSFIPLIAYAIWQWLILGIVPTFESGGRKKLAAGQNAVHPLKNFIQNPGIYIIAQFFAFFALVTSFLGVMHGLVDFLADGLQVPKTSFNKLWLLSKCKEQ